MIKGFNVMLDKNKLIISSKKMSQVLNEKKQSGQADLNIKKKDVYRCAHTFTD